jgi:hypothetical protein
VLRRTGVALASPAPFGTRCENACDVSSFQEHDPLATFLEREQARLLGYVMLLADGHRSALSGARKVVSALDDAEAEVLYPAFSRVRLRLDLQQLLADSRADRAEQLTALEALAHKRAPRLRKLAAVALGERITRDGERYVGLSSQLPRVLHCAIADAFIARFCEIRDRASSFVGPTACRSIASGDMQRAHEKAAGR